MSCSHGLGSWMRTVPTVGPTSTTLVPTPGEGWLRLPGSTQYSRNNPLLFKGLASSLCWSESVLLSITVHHFVLYFSLHFASAGKCMWFKYFKSSCSFPKMSFFPTLNTPSFLNHSENMVFSSSSS